MRAWRTKQYKYWLDITREKVRKTFDKVTNLKLLLVFLNENYFHSYVRHFERVKFAWKQRTVLTAFLKQRNPSDIWANHFSSTRLSRTNAYVVLGLSRHALAPLNTKIHIHIYMYRGVCIHRYIFMYMPSNWHPTYPSIINVRSCALFFFYYYFYSFYPTKYVESQPGEQTIYRPLITMNYGCYIESSTRIVVDEGIIEPSGKIVVFCFSPRQMMYRDNEEMQTFLFFSTCKPSYV